MIEKDLIIPCKCVYSNKLKKFIKIDSLKIKYDRDSEEYYLYSIETNEKWEDKKDIITCNFDLLNKKFTQERKIICANKLIKDLATPGKKVIINKNNKLYNEVNIYEIMSTKLSDKPHGGIDFRFENNIEENINTILNKYNLEIISDNLSEIIDNNYLTVHIIEYPYKSILNNGKEYISNFLNFMS